MAAILLVTVMVFTAAGPAMAAPRAEVVMDMRTGEVLLAENADTQLHPASLTKMMTLYIAFEAIEHGEIGLDTMVTISQHAANEPPSKLGLKAGQKIQLRYLIRAAAVKSANDAATAIGEAISGSEAAFARRMNRTALAIGMTRTHFKNANGLTENGHLSTARDMTILGRHVFYDYPDYYHLFSRKTVDVPGATLPNTNRKFLAAYKGADGIKTGYTNAAGFNLVASAERGGKRVIATMFGGSSTAARNARVAELLDFGFKKVPDQVAANRPSRPGYVGDGGDVVIAQAGQTAPATASTIIRHVAAPTTSIRPRPRPGSEPQAPSETLVASLEAGIEKVIGGLEGMVEDPEVEAALAAARAATPFTGAPAPEPRPETEAIAAVATGTEADLLPEIEGVVEQVAMLSAPTPAPNPGIILDTIEVADKAPPRPEVVTRMSTSGGRHWGVTVGNFQTRDGADRMLIRTALSELPTLGEALRKVVPAAQGFDANFVGMTQEGADLACRRLEARGADCVVIGPPS